MGYFKIWESINLHQLKRELGDLVYPSSLNTVEDVYLKTR